MILDDSMQECSLAGGTTVAPRASIIWQDSSYLGAADIQCSSLTALKDRAVSLDCRKGKNRDD